MSKKILLVTFSDNADHQDTMFGLYEQMVKTEDVYLLCIKKPKVPLIKSNRTWMVDCPKRPGITKKTFNVLLILLLVYRMKSQKFDVIYFESLHIWNLFFMILAGKKTHTYQVIHEVIPHAGDSQEKMVDLMNKVVTKLADTIILRNKTYMPVMIERYGIHPERVKYLELWRRYPRFTPSVYNKKVLFFGRINPYKGANNLLEIVHLCPAIHFDVIGKADPRMQDIVSNLEKEPNIHLINEYVSDVQMREAFINCDWVIVPYHSASQSGVIIDAYKYSRPVIAFKVGAITEQVDEGKSGYLVEAEKVTEFADTLKAAIGMERDEYDKMCRQAYLYGARKYAAAGAVERFVKLLDE